MHRYARQSILPQVGVQGQTALKNSKVLLVGAGGLGLPCAQSLVAAGVGHITVIDDDRVSLSNLQRQFLFHESDIGRYKVEVLHERLSAQNSDVKIRTIVARLDINNALGLIGEHDLVIDGSDNFATKFLINDACLLKKTPWIYGSVSRFEGQLAMFSSTGLKEHSCYRCLYEKMPMTQIENCAEQGVFGAVTGIVGNYQALEALKILIKLNMSKKESFAPLLEPKTDVLQIFDFQSLEQLALFIPKREACFCGNIETLELIQEEATTCELGAERNWSDFEQDTNKKILLDVRSSEEFQTGHHKHGQLWNADVQQKITHGNLGDVGMIYLYCTSGKRAREKCIELRKNGITAYYIKDFTDLF